MEKSESIKNLTAALIKAQGKLEIVRKDTQAYNYKYATLPAVWDEYKKHFLGLGLVVIQAVEGNGLRTTLAHESGEWVSSVANLMPVKNDPQAQGSAITYMRRYALGAICGILSEVDNDDDAKKAMPDTPKAEDTTPDAKTAPKAVSGPLYANGKVSGYWPPKGKGPHTFKVGDSGYLKTFDAETAEDLITYKVSGEEVQVVYGSEIKDGYKNNMIISVEKKEELPF